MKLFAALACLLLAIAGPAPAHARPTPLALPAEVWVNPAANMSVPAYFAMAYVNRYTGTQMTCAYPAAGYDGCAPAPCPSRRMCLTIRWGVFDDDSQDARFEPLLCSGVCTQAGLIEINPEGPLYGRVNPWGPLQHRLLLETYIGIFAGLPPQPQCVSSMSHYSCGIEGFTAAEAAHLAGW